MKIRGNDVSMVILKESPSGKYSRIKLLYYCAEPFNKDGKFEVYDQWSDGGTTVLYRGDDMNDALDAYFGFLIDHSVSFCW